MRKIDTHERCHQEQHQLEQSKHFSDQWRRVSTVYLHGNKIAEVVDDFVRVFDGGWQEHTTKSRLNAIINEFCNAFTDGIFQKDLHGTFVTTKSPMISWMVTPLLSLPDDTRGIFPLLLPTPRPIVSLFHACAACLQDSSKLSLFGRGSLSAALIIKATNKQTKSKWCLQFNPPHGPNLTVWLRVHPYCERRLWDRPPMGHRLQWRRDHLEDGISGSNEVGSCDTWRSGRLCRLSPPCPYNRDMKQTTSPWHNPSSMRRHLCHISPS